MKYHYISVANFILKCTSNWIWLQFRMIFAHFRPREEKNSLKKYYSLDRTETNDFVTRAHRALFWMSLRPGHFLTISRSSWYLRGAALNIFSRPFYLLEDVVIFSTKPTGFLTFVLILSTGDCNVDISEQVVYQVNDLVRCRISRL